VRVRQALNYCIDRAGLVTFLNGTAEPSIGWLKQKDAGFGAFIQSGEIAQRHSEVKERSWSAGASIRPPRVSSASSQVCSGPRAA
jgi:ABC-type transport system substrate-binding protein